MSIELAKQTKKLSKHWKNRHEEKAIIYSFIARLKIVKLLKVIRTHSENAFELLSMNERLVKKVVKQHPQRPTIRNRATWWRKW